MRVGICGPAKWKWIRKRHPEQSELAMKWLSLQLDLASMKGPVEGISSLMLGLDTFFANLCISKGIPLTVFLACKDQDAFWDSENKETFLHLLKVAKEIKYISEEEYSLGCIKNQTKAITDWLAKKDDSKLYLVRYKRLSKTQSERVKALTSREHDILTFKI